MDISIETVAREYIKTKSPESVITLDMVERPGVT